MQDKIRFVSFDAGFTLIYTDPPVGEVYADIASRFGYHLDGDEVQKRFKETWKIKNKENRLNPSTNAQADETRAYSWWKEIFTASIDQSIDTEHLDDMFDLCYHEYAKGKYWKLYPGIRGTLAALKAEGFGLAVLSNWDKRLEQTLRELELDRFFDKIYISTQIGYAKPDPRAFNYVLFDLNIKPHELLHVGDSLHEDVLAAREAGISAVYLDREGKYSNAMIPDDQPVIKNLTQLAGLYTKLPVP